MGCGISIKKNQANKSERVIKAAILIQRWYRSYVARMELKRQYALSIFQSIEYAEEQAQLQLSNFFTFMLNHVNEFDPDIKSHFVSIMGDYNIASSDPAMTEYERRIEVPASYRGPRLCFPLTAADINALLQAFKHHQQLHARYVLQLFHETRKVLQQMPNITHLSTSYAKEITICGDLHGKLDDLLLIFYKNGLPSEENPYVFNGDFVDRGKNSIEILIILFAFLLVYPNHLHLNRGNHEDHIMNLRYGFTKEVMKKYQCHGTTILHLLRDVYSWLPLATIIDNKVLILHGGISDTTDLKFLNLFQRNKLKSVLNPPKSNAGTGNEPRRATLTDAHPVQVKKSNSGSHVSSKEATKSMSASSNSRQYSKRQHPDNLCHRTVSHPVVEVQHCKPSSVTKTHTSPELTPKEWKQVITIFSASNYYEEGSNRGAYIKLNPDLIPRFVQYQVSKSTPKRTLQQRVSTIELSALKCLREKIYIHKSELIAAVRQYDRNGTGKISPSEWVSAVESVLQLDLPWRTLRSRLVCLDQDGNVEYLSSFDDVEIKLPIKEVQPSLVETLCRYKADLESIFNMIDRDHSGLISIDEFHQAWKLFNLHLKIAIDDESIDSLARCIDFNKDGSIDFNEFLEAFHVVHKLEKRYSS
ncbi:serine/threonine-protein phosphatase with EF-hands 1 isoform X2 [Anolis sagrei]|uniref:serine/threonine-protein phosphatase with EF-hands 1 isoform X2 n=1 Tax=Anolis sagrei TaxID=38937 RepID=UPI0035217087